jgi:hypothetical protein
MLKHLTDGQLRAYQDGEADQPVADHLDSCPTCRARLPAATARAAHLAASLATLAPTPTELPDTPHAALNRLKERQRKENSMFNALFAKRFRPLWASGAVIAAFAVALTFPPVQALATNFLGLFRVQRIEVVQVDPSRISELNSDEALGQRLGQMFSDSFKVTKEAGQPHEVSDAAAASAAAGFSVRLPDNKTTPTLTVQDSTAFEFTINRDRAQAILNDSGFSDHQLPASLDGQLIKVEIPASVAAAYGTCPKPSAEEANPTNFDQLQDCVILAQIPSPTVTAPPNLDMAELTTIGLQFIGMSPEDAQHLSETVDWSSTLIIPIPRNAASVEDVTVDGVSGTLLRRTADDGVPERYTLIWVKDGIVYALSGFGLAEAALNLANSLK